ncbi:MAG TPA: hypothetical protein PK997_05420, partial [Candidatus Omnitrophota bacterium]|nr:hypothetical protein [Candidatus Omnitrophota bacterium]
PRTKPRKARCGFHARPVYGSVRFKFAIENKNPHVIIPPLRTRWVRGSGFRSGIMASFLAATFAGKDFFLVKRSATLKKG